MSGSRWFVARASWKAPLLLSLLGACAGGSAAVPHGAATPQPASDEAGLDAVLTDGWKAAGVTPAPIADDGEYQRRVTLDLVGRPPRLEELAAFAADTAADKRARLVDRLLADPGAGEHWADVEGDLVFGKEREKRIEKHDPRGYLAAAFNQNRPYDKVATELLTATGTLRDAPATAFLVTRLRGGGGPEAVAGAAARVFLGLSIQCAQCHDHPYDTRWKQADFHGLVGYFARTKSRKEKGMMTMDETFELVDQKRGEAKMHPPGATEDVVVKPRFLGRELRGLADETRRVTFARAVVESDLFAKALVGRVWARLFGAGPVDPWDDLGAEREAKHPALLTRLAQDFRASGFDTKRLLKRMVLSTAYQRSGGGRDDDGAATRTFARARVRPLTPEQLFRTLMVATGAEAMARTRLARRGDGETELSPDERLARLTDRTLKEYRFAFDDDEMADTDFDGTLPQALLLLNGELTNTGTRATGGGVLAGILAATPDPAARIEQLFLAAYARRPSADEAAATRALIAAGLQTDATAQKRKGQRNAAYEDAFFALLTSTEAVTNH